MRLRVFHRTRYSYRAPVRDSYNEVRLRPVTADQSRLEFSLVTVNPPSRLRHFRDDWLNYVHYFEIPEPHSELVIESQCTVKTTSQYAAGRPAGVSFEALTGERDEVLASFLGASRYVDVSPEVWRMAIDVRADDADVFDVAAAIMGHIHQHWVYAPNSTSASTHMQEVIETRRGVCQDFSHVMIGMCRTLGIPARYVSGYLYDGADSHLRGSQASHAWCEVHVPGRGWFGLDPTNNILVDERHIKVATGRDYHDAAPVSGYFDGPPGATAAMDVHVQIERLDG